MFITFREIIDIVMMSAIVGVIFSSLLQRFRHSYSTGFDWENYKLAIIVAAPAIILHELGHKFVAMGFGYNAVFNAAYIWLLIGLALALAKTGIIFFVPAYVSISNPLGGIAPGPHALIAFAGPAVNLLLWLGSMYLLKYGKVKHKNLPAVYLTKQINMFLFIFNMLPIPGFDGSKVLAGVLSLI